MSPHLDQKIENWRTGNIVANRNESLDA